MRFNAYRLCSCRCPASRGGPCRICYWFSPHLARISAGAIKREWDSPRNAANALKRDAAQNDRVPPCRHLIPWCSPSLQTGTAFQHVQASPHMLKGAGQARTPEKVVGSGSCMRQAPILPGRAAGSSPWVLAWSLHQAVTGGRCAKGV